MSSALVDVGFFDSALALMDRAFYSPDSPADLLAVQQEPVSTGKKAAKPLSHAKLARQRARDVYNPAASRPALLAAMTRAATAAVAQKGVATPQPVLTKKQRKEKARQEQEQLKQQRQQQNPVAAESSPASPSSSSEASAPLVGASEHMQALRGRLKDTLVSQRTQRIAEQSVRDKAAKQRRLEQEGNAGSEGSNKRKQRSGGRENNGGDDEEDSEEGERPSRPLTKRGKAAAAGNDKKQKPSAKQDSKKKHGSDDDGGDDDDDDVDLQFGSVADASKLDGMTALDGKRQRMGRETKQAALKKAVARQERLAEIRAEDPEQAEELEHRHAVKAALLRSQGVVVRDDPALIKKSIRREVKGKQKSSKAWKEREKKVKLATKDKQNARYQNLTARAKEKVHKKMAKKGLVDF